MISIIVPCYNEESIIEIFTNTLEKELDKLDDKFELIFVDNNSTDNTFSLIKKTLSNNHRYKIIRLANYFGKESAILSGLDNATGESSIIMDPDLEDPPDLIPELIKKWKAGNEVVFTIRKSEKLPTYKKILKFFFYKILVFSSADHNKIYANSGDFRIIDKKIVEHIKTMRERTRFLRGLVNYIGYNQTFIEYERSFRKKGKSKSSINFLIKYGFDSLVSFSNVPISLVTKFGLILFILIIVFSIFLLIQRLFGTAIEGFTTVLLFMGLLSSFNILALGIVGEYVSRIYSEVKGRPNYIIDRIETNN
ncbi:glycosyltransferase family 2 protein [Pelagibacteraceae bacterium]|nr:glycosyltransferase family 2 protein [Pelagibacteraceae bacterium]